MYTVIRRYQGVVNAEEVARRAIQEFAPTLRDQPGFQGYWVVAAGDGVITTISIFDSREVAEESAAASATWVQENLSNLVPNPPRVTSGETTTVGTGIPA